MDRGNEDIKDDLKEDSKLATEEGTKDKMKKVYPILLAITLSVSALSGYKYLMNLKDKSDTDKKTEQLVQDIKPEVLVDKNPYLAVDLKPLKEKNNDVVGWLKVGGVGIDIPIVQTTDNKFYLDNDIDKKKNSTGWVFVDTRGNLDHMALNTVLYGHNVRGRHFGLLKKFLDPEVANKKDANIIQLTTENKQMVFEIVSVYITHYEDWEYVKTHFSSDEERMNFVNHIKDRNQVKAFQKENLSGSDNYITFSTCHGQIGTDKRLVVHAKLVASRLVPTK